MLQKTGREKGFGAVFGVIKSAKDWENPKAKGRRDFRVEDRILFHWVFKA